MKVNKLNIFDKSKNLNHKIIYYNELKNKYKNLEFNIIKYDINVVKTPYFSLTIKDKYGILFFNFERLQDLKNFILYNQMLFIELNNAKMMPFNKIIDKMLGDKYYYSIWSDSVNMLSENRFNLTHFINSELQFRNYLTILINRYYMIKKIN